MYPARITRLVDGDTFHAELLIGDARLGLAVWLPDVVRLNGYDAPGKATPAGKAATAQLAALAPAGATLSLAPTTRDKYGRIVCDALLSDGTSLVAQLIERGAGVAWDGHGAHPPGGGA